LGSTCNNTRIKVNFRYHSNYHLPHAGFFLLAKYFTNSTVYFLKSILLWMKFKNKVSKSGIDFIFSDVSADNNSIKRILILSRLYYKFFWKKLDIKGKKMCLYLYLRPFAFFCAISCNVWALASNLKKQIFSSYDSKAWEIWNTYSMFNWYNTSSYVLLE
jgi:hypothetical protein